MLQTKFLHSRLCGFRDDLCFFSNSYMSKKKFGKGLQEDALHHILELWDYRFQTKELSSSLDYPYNLSSAWNSNPWITVGELSRQVSYNLAHYCQRSCCWRMHRGTVSRIKTTRTQLITKVHIEHFVLKWAVDFMTFQQSLIFFVNFVKSAGWIIMFNVIVVVSIAYLKGFSTFKWFFVLFFYHRGWDSWTKDRSCRRINDNANVFGLRSKVRVHIILTRVQDTGR